jgi:hypothetical protein
MPLLSDSGETWESRPLVARTHLAAAVPSAVAPEPAGLELAATAHWWALGWELVRLDSWVVPGPADSSVKATAELSIAAAQQQARCKKCEGRDSRQGCSTHVSTVDSRKRV